MLGRAQFGGRPGVMVEDGGSVTLVSCPVSVVQAVPGMLFLIVQPPSLTLGSSQRLCKPPNGVLISVFLHK